MEAEVVDIGKKVGEITHYFSHINVAVVKLSNALNTGDKVRIKGSTTDFEQVIDSMQVDHAKVEKAEKGKEIGMKVKERVREGDKLFKQ